jgi:uncharacterized membrane protein HdeD (DUF308 family)
MIRTQFILLRKIWLWGLIITCGLLAACIAFVSIISIWVGIENPHQPGGWVPILAGTLSLAITSWIFLAVTKSILRQIEEEGLANL